VDVLNPEQRRLNMSRIRGRDTKPEMIVRKALNARGYRFRLHRRDLPGRPDLVLPKWQTAIFVHGCFWHRHDCRYFKMPETREDFWQKKIARNVERDRAAQAALGASGWRTLTIWECALRGKDRLTLDEFAHAVDNFLSVSDAAFGEIPGGKA
jgi:DNA mismatch endonuclease (patch repair protein)